METKSSTSIWQIWNQWAMMLNKLRNIYFLLFKAKASQLKWVKERQNLSVQVQMSLDKKRCLRILRNIFLLAITLCDLCRAKTRKQEYYTHSISLDLYRREYLLISVNLAHVSAWTRTCHNPLFTPLMLTKTLWIRQTIPVQVQRQRNQKIWT